MAKDDGGQLSLLGGGSEPAPAAALGRTAAPRWAKFECKGRLGVGSLDVDAEELSRAHKASVVLVVAKDAASWSEVNLLDVRHLALPLTDVGVERQVAALVADARAGRRVCVLASDETLAAYLVGLALVELGADAADASAALGGRSALGPERYAALVDHSVARGRERRRDSTPLFAHAGREAPADPFAGLDAEAERVVGVVLGAAIGDAIGHPTEFVRSFEAIRAQWPPDGVQGYVIFIDEGGRRVAPYTDDTQMAEQVLRGLLAARAAELDAAMIEIAGRFVTWAADPQGGHRAPGNACLAGCKALAAGTHWSEAGGERAGGCGSVMRAYPFGLVFRDDLARAEAWAVAHSRLTHRDPIALAACAAMAVGVARTLRGEPVTGVISEMIAAACRYSAKTAEMMALALHEAQTGIAPEVTLTRLQGWAAHEAIAAAVYLVARHPEDPRAAILEAANTPGDSDSLATLAGALVGARVGVRQFPRSWIDELERSAELLALAREI